MQFNGARTWIGGGWGGLLKPPTGTANPMEPPRASIKFFCHGCFREERLEVEGELSVHPRSDTATKVWFLSIVSKVEFVCIVCQFSKLHMFTKRGIN